jgi:nucleotide-binding universal stress UspA family protein
VTSAAQPQCWEAKVYQRILLAYDGSLEGRTALREGALLAKGCGAKVFLLSVVAETPGLLTAEGAHAGAVARQMELSKTVFEEGVARLRRMGFEPDARLVAGEPAQEIQAYARQVSADLVVVGHRKQNAFARWWAGSTGATLLDRVDCSILVARHVISDEAYETKLSASTLAKA